MGGLAVIGIIGVGVNVSATRGVVLVVACWSVSVVLPPVNFMLKCVS